MVEGSFDHANNEQSDSSYTRLALCDSVLSKRPHSKNDGLLLVARCKTTYEDRQNVSLHPVKSG